MSSLATLARRAAAPLLLIAALTGCRSAQAAPPAATAPAAVPQVPTDCGAPTPNSTAGGADPRQLSDLVGLLQDGRTLSAALSAEYGEPVDSLSAGEADAALHVLAALDSCPAVPVSAKADVPRLVRMIALGAPAPPVLTDPPPAGTSAH